MPTQAPTPTPDSEFFWEGLKNHSLLLPYCKQCDLPHFPPLPGCPLCGANSEFIEPREATGDGTVYSWIVAHYPFDPSLATEVPYTILTVDLTEGVRVNGRLKDASPDDLKAGQPVRVEYDDRDSFTLLCFTPA